MIVTCKNIFGLTLIILSFTLVNTALAEASFKKHKNIAYIDGTENRKQKLDVYVPVTKATNMPVHIYVHGGAWTIGDKRMIKSKEVDVYTSNGVILVTLGYRLSPKYKHPAHIQDIAAGVKWVKDNISGYGGNPENMVLSGHSAGAHLVALLGTHPKYMADQGLSLDMFKAIIPVDTASFDFRVDQPQLLIQKIRNNAFGEDLESKEDASPTVQVSSGAAYSPFLIYVTGKRKDAVTSSRDFLNTLEKNKHSAKLYILPGLSHAEMQHEIFTSGADIHQKIMDYLKVWAR